MQPCNLRAEAMQRATEVLSTVSLPPGTALLATGSFARNEMTPFSDLDLVLLYRNQPPQSLDMVWYPIWDAQIRVDHAVRTPEECAAIIGSDITSGLALLDMVFVAGDQDLFAYTRELVLRQWRADVRRNFTAVVDTASARWRRSGSVVTMTRPDIKHGRGGLRDIELLRALALGNLCDAPAVAGERELLLDTRTLLHIEARRKRDVLDPEFAADIAFQLGFHDRYELSKKLAENARTIDEAVTGALHVARQVLPTGRRYVRKPLDLDVVDNGGAITLSRQPNVEDPGLVLRVAAAAARTGLSIDPSVWSVLRRVPPLPEPWPKAAVYDFFSILASNAFIVADLDRHGLWTRFVPEWEQIRGLMPRERTHIHTIDMHSLATVEQCSTVHVARPDLLLLAALYHDIGKGYGRPHSQVGAEFVTQQAQRMGLNLRDRSSVQFLVSEHTLLLKLATTADPAAETTVDILLDALGYDLLAVELLEALTEADARATGPNVWTPRTSAAVVELAHNARQRLTQLQPIKPMVAVSQEIALQPGPKVLWRGAHLRDCIRVLAVFAARNWKIESAKIVDATHSGGMCQAEFDVRIGFEGTEGFIQTYKSGVHSMVPKPIPAATATYWFGNIFEVRTVDRPGVLSALIAVLPEISWATLDTPGATCIARFHLATGFDRARVERDVTRVLATG
ncbi:[protein-PII] uridylyltransferase [Corynebacterium freiburgense]|uniref:[protein-PII] uridylyltransferase n=1 Tax=Corynebacterium freiburgense TaxID=556548 RepID=UPI000418F08B|nr:[protein-PII] uridylyltransferase [Corynebacterium freiburgense]WJZ03047.1 Bifunctional uridylyltransferase/uridylyl-removing enzyme [Corynebacterium freiburgense]